MSRAWRIGRVSGRYLIISMLLAYLCSFTLGWRWSSHDLGTEGPGVVPLLGVRESLVFAVLFFVTYLAVALGVGVVHDTLCLRSWSRTREALLLVGLLLVGQTIVELVEGMRPENTLLPLLWCAVRPSGVGHPSGISRAELLTEMLVTMTPLLVALLCVDPFGRMPGTRPDDSVHELDQR